MEETVNKKNTAYYGPQGGDSFTRGYYNGDGNAPFSYGKLNEEELVKEFTGNINKTFVKDKEEKIKLKNPVKPKKTENQLLQGPNYSDLEI